MKIRYYITTICLALAALSVSAQTISDELRTEQKGQGKVVINQSADIEQLVNTVPVKPVTQPKSTTTATPGTSAHAADAAATGQHTPATAQKNDQPRQGAVHNPGTTATEEVTSAPAVDTSKKIMRRSYKTNGFRIQVYSGGNKREDRSRCEMIASQLKSSFPDQPIYVHFYSPSWKCRMGNFTSQTEAQAVLKQVKAMGYSQACLVKGTINVQY